MNRAQRRAKIKAAKSRNKNHADHSSGPDAIDMYRLNTWTGSGRKILDSAEKSEPLIPGKNCPPVLAYFNQMVESNMWHDRKELDEYVNTIKELSTEYDFKQPMFQSVDAPKDEGVPKWSWVYNGNCKYINLRFDMRDGGFVMTNDKGQRICLEQLKWQYNG